MAFVFGNFDKLSQEGLTGVPRQWGYRTAADNKAAVGGSAYFNEVNDRVSIGDFVFINASDGPSVRTVTAVTPNVTTALLALT